MLRLSSLATFLLACTVLLSSARAQSTFGSIVGVVHDATQAVVPGASVEIKSLEDNSTRSTLSDQNGSFEFVNLKPGKYALSTQAEGFSEFKIPSAEHRPADAEDRRQFSHQESDPDGGSSGHGSRD